MLFVFPFFLFHINVWICFRSCFSFRRALFPFFDRSWVCVCIAVNFNFMRMSREFMWKIRSWTKFLLAYYRITSFPSMKIDFLCVFFSLFFPASSIVRVICTVFFMSFCFSLPLTWILFAYSFWYSRFFPSYNIRYHYFPNYFRSHVAF